MGLSEFAVPPLTARVPKHWRCSGVSISGLCSNPIICFATLTAAENVRLALDVRGERGREAMAKTEEVRASVGLVSKLGSFPRHGGALQLPEPSSQSPRQFWPMNPLLHSMPLMGVKSWQLSLRSLRKVIAPLSSSPMIPQLFDFADRIIHI